MKEKRIFKIQKNKNKIYKKFLNFKKSFKIVKTLVLLEVNLMMKKKIMKEVLIVQFKLLTLKNLDNLKEKILAAAC